MGIGYSVAIKGEKEEIIMNKFKELNDRYVKTMAREITYICEEAIDHEYGFKQFVELLKNRMDIENGFKNFEEFVNKL